MACYKPIPAYQDGRGKVILNPPLKTENLAIPCGKCIGCRTDYATQWARRCEHEAKQYIHNTFINLTYADDRLPREGLRSDHLRNFIKRIRKRTSLPNRSPISRDPRVPIRYFACGEYGTNTGRPHYHAILFNAGFDDRYTVGEKHGHKLYESEELSKLWPYGSHKLGDATPAAANYIAKYALKKQGRYDKGAHNADGEWIEPPFLRMSLKPPLGAFFVEKYYKDLQKGYLVTNGIKHAIPRHYKTLLKRNHPQLYEEMRARMDKQRRENPTDKNDPARLEAAERIHQQKKQTQERKF